MYVCVCVHVCHSFNFFSSIFVSYFLVLSLVLTFCCAVPSWEQVERLLYWNESPRIVPFSIPSLDAFLSSPMPPVSLGLPSHHAVLYSGQCDSITDFPVPYTPLPAQPISALRLCIRGLDVTIRTGLASELRNWAGFGGRGIPEVPHAPVVAPPEHSMHIDLEVRPGHCLLL